MSESEVRKPSLIPPPFTLSSLVHRLEEQSDKLEKERRDSNGHSEMNDSHTCNSSHERNGGTMTPRNSRADPLSRVHQEDSSTVSSSRTTSTDSLFNNMSLVSPSFTPVPDSLKTEDLGSSDDDEVNPPRSLLELPKVVCESRARIPTTTGSEIFLHLYKNDQDDKEHLAIVFGQHIHSKSLFERRPGETEQDRMTRGAYVGKLYPGRQKSSEDGTSNGMPKSELDTLVRIHSECYTGETAWSARCDCGEQLDEAARLMHNEGSGVIVYLRQEGRGIGLGEKLKAYNLQDLGADTVTANLMLRHPADGRSFGLATAILKDLGLDRVRLLTNNPDKIKAVEGKHKEVKVTQRVPMVPLSWQNKGGFRSKEVEQYLKTKVERMGHMLEISTKNVMENGDEFEVEREETFVHDPSVDKDSA